MLAAIGFDAKHRLHAKEVEDIPADRMLSAKLEADQSSVAQDVPEFSFCVRRLVPHFAGETLEPRAWIAPLGHDLLIVCRKGMKSTA
jgi:hypothetical protein